MLNLIWIVVAQNAVQVRWHGRRMIPQALSAYLKKEHVLFPQVSVKVRLFGWPFIARMLSAPQRPSKRHKAEPARQVMIRAWQFLAASVHGNKLFYFNKSYDFAG